MNRYSDFIRMLDSLIEDESDPITITANASALIFESLDNVNWSGFYRVINNELLLGPFQGKPACMHIQFDKGVCGYAYTNDKVTVVDDVHVFPGHIACDSASNSEIVLPIHSSEGKVIALLDIDSPVFSRFGSEEEEYLRCVVSSLEKVFNHNGVIVF